MARVLVVGDIHAPATHKNYLKFVKKIQAKYDTTKTVFIGDIIDHEAISRHQKNPNLPASLDEYVVAQKEVKKWYNSFPNSIVTIGNHDDRVCRRAESEGIPGMYLKSFNDVYGTAGWEWVHEYEYDNVLYTHGTGWGGKTPAFNAANFLRKSVVCGHTHSIAAISWHNNGTDLLFGMNVGCGIDNDHLAMSYGRFSLKKPIISCGVVINSKPYLEIM